MRREKEKRIPIIRMIIGYFDFFSLERFRQNIRSKFKFHY